MNKSVDSVSTPQFDLNSLHDVRQLNFAGETARAAEFRARTLSLSFGGASVVSSIILVFAVVSVVEHAFIFGNKYFLNDAEAASSAFFSQPTVSVKENHQIADLTHLAVEAVLTTGLYCITQPRKCWQMAKQYWAHAETNAKQSHDLRAHTLQKLHAV